MVKDTWRIHGNLVLPDGPVRPGTVTVVGKKIVAVDEAEEPPEASTPLLKTPAGSFVGPGLIDLHTHGANGADFMAAKVDGAHDIATFAAQHGVSALLASTVSGTRDAIGEALRTVSKAVDQQTEAENFGVPLLESRLLGAHLEGPYLSQERRGGQDPAAIRPADIDEFEHWASLGPIRMITVAPEVAGVDRLTAFIVKNHPEVVVAAGHTNASYDQTQAAIAAGVRHFTHFFCGMSGFHHRQPGAVGAGFVDSPATIELIADLIHVHPAALRLVATLRGSDKIALVTDSVNFCGLPDGTYTKRGRQYRVAGGSIRLPDGTLAGSQLTMNVAVRNMARTGVGVATAWRMASTVPAAILGMERTRGALAPGMDADIAVLDRNFTAQCTIIAGTVVHDAIRANPELV